jgi:hypothetical protein
MFARHLPPSAGLPRVFVVDEASARELPEAIERVNAGDDADAVVGRASPEGLARWFAQLRPGGRLILAHPAPAEELLKALTDAGFIHCLVEPQPDGLTLYRGERPPLGDSVARLESLITHHVSRATPFIFLLITQSPNKPAWKVAPDEVIEWRAATIVDPATSAPSLLAFTSLVKAVAFMQPAVLAGFITGVNKVGKFPRAMAQAWPLPFHLNPDFEAVRAWRAGPSFGVDPRTAVTGDE